MTYYEPLKQKPSQLSLDGLFFRLWDMEMMRWEGHRRGEQQLTGTHLLMVVMSGQGRLTLGYEEFRLQRDTAYLCAAGETFGIETENQDGVKLCLFRFDVCRRTEGELECIPSRSAEPWFPLQGEIPVYPAGMIASLCETIYHHRRSPDELERFRGQIAFQELLYHVLKSSQLQPEHSRPSIKTAKEYIERHFDENLTIEQLARMAQVSPKYFVDLFKKTYGISAINYLTERRINRAKELMAQSHAKLRVIAHQVGYNDEFYFSRKFKKEVGVPPKVYMNRRRRKIAAYHSSIVGQLLALKIIPYAAPLHPKWTPYYYHMYGKDISVHLSAYRQNLRWEANIKKLHHAQPDVVVSTDELDPDEKEKLDHISPMLYVSKKEKNWQDQLRGLAQFLGETEEAEHWLKRYDRKITYARELLHRSVNDDTFLIVRISKQTLYVYCNRSMNEVVYQDLGLNPAGQFDQPVYDQPVTIEQLAHFDADRLILIVRQEDETLAYWKSLQYANPWQELKAVRNNSVYLVSSDPWFEYSACAHNRIVDEMLALLSEDCP